MYWRAWSLMIACGGRSIFATTTDSEDAFLTSYIPAGSNVNPDTYIVSYKRDHTLDAHLDFLGVNLTEVADAFVHHENFGSYMVKCSPSLIHDYIRRDPGIEWVIQDSFIKMEDPPPNVDKSKTQGSEGDSLVERSEQPLVEDATHNLTKRWGAAEAGSVTSTWFTQLTTTRKVSASKGHYQGMEKAGLGVNIYILDSGINGEHIDFRGSPRVSNFKGETTTHYTTPKGLDPNKNKGQEKAKRCHGTMMASLAAGRYYGLARGANIINVRTFNDDDESAQSDLTNAINDIVAEHKDNKAGTSSDFRGSVILLAQGHVDAKQTWGSFFQALSGARDENIPVIAAAGNSGCDVAGGCGLGPIVPCSWSIKNAYGDGLGNVWCVGSMDSAYFQSTFSNWGQAVQAWTPGENIIGASCDDNINTMQDSGSSEASAFAAGIMATFLSWVGPENNYMALNILMAENGIDGALVARKPPANRLVLTNGYDSGLRYRGPFAWAPNGPFVWKDDIPDYWAK